MSRAREIRLDRLVFGRNPPAGMDWSVVGHWAAFFRKAAAPCKPAVRVTEIPGTKPRLYRVSEGRHRVIGALFAGRDTIRCKVDRSP